MSTYEVEDEFECVVGVVEHIHDVLDELRALVITREIVSDEVTRCGVRNEESNADQDQDEGCRR